MSDHETRWYRELFRSSIYGLFLLRKDDRMKRHTSDELRQMFLDYFKENGHMIEPGAPLVPINDPSLLWINSGVAALKKYFDGSVRLENPRIANSQRSIRTNDIENVGITARHHTMFEMLGNFSIGDYFKKEAIQFSWEFLTSPKWVGFDKDKLYVTIYPDDNEAFDIWHNVIGLDENRIFRLEGNFWEIGSGPCGPNSEIFFDRGPKYDPENIGIRLLADDLDNDRYIEIWNVVFSQFNAVEGEDRADYKPLPQQNIDTGMGLERLTSIVQEADTNFETDLFMPIIEKTCQLSGVAYEGQHKRAFKVIADHIRAITFALSDGATFSNEGRGYVLKRLLRRAARYGLELNLNKPFLYELVPTVVNNMKTFYPYLLDKEDLVIKLVKIEEEKFAKTLSSGLKLYEQVKEESKDTKVISGIDAFKLYDTYGFPIELVEELSDDAGYKVDMDGFNVQMEKQKELARASFKDSANMNNQSADLLAFEAKSEFVGYDVLTLESKVIGLFKEGVSVENLVGIGEVVFEQTPFYANSGGQVSDLGRVVINDVTYEVIDVKKAPNGQHLHLIEAEEVKIGDSGLLSVDRSFRQLVQRNHTATHLLHQALHEVIGKHANQAGSYVSNDYLRFDFTHFEKISKEDLALIEEKVNNAIFSDYVTDVEHMSMDQAKAKGAMALFGDKYDNDNVRVVQASDGSIELCGGTHVHSTSEIGLFKIEKEESVGSGVRRIVAKTSKGAYEMLKEKEALLNESASLLNVNDVNKVKDKIVSVNNEVKTLKGEISSLKEAMLNNTSNNASETITINGIDYVITLLESEDVKDLKAYIDNIKNEKTNTIGIVYASVGKKPYVVGVTQDLIAKGYLAKDIANAINVTFNGKGGGKADMAQGGTSERINVDTLKQLLK